MRFYINTIKKAINNIPSVRLKMEVALPSRKTSLAIINITKADKRQSGISIQMVEDFTATGNIMAEMPRIINILMMLLPIAFPKLKPVFPDTADNTFTISSGEEVPKATIVSPITRLDIFFLLAMAAAPSTSQLAPKIKGTKPKIEKKRFCIKFVFLTRPSRPSRVGTTWKRQHDLEASARPESVSTN